jgi:hypothetical protein
MLRENITAILARNEPWAGHAATEPYEAGWAIEAVIFVRALKPPVGRQPMARVEISPDGMHWLPEGTEIALPATQDALACARIAHFGNWLRVVADFEDDASTCLLVTLHLKG